MVMSVRERYHAKIAATKNVAVDKPPMYWRGELLDNSCVNLPDDSDIEVNQEVEAILADASNVEYMLDLLGWNEPLTYWEYNMLQTWARENLAFDD